MLRIVFIGFRDGDYSTAQQRYGAVIPFTFVLQNVGTTSYDRVFYWHYG